MLVQKLSDLPRLSDIPQYVALDVETHEDLSLEGFSIAFLRAKKIESCYIPLAHEFTDMEAKKYHNIDFNKGIDYMKRVVKNRNVIFHNAQFDLSVIWQYDVEIPTEKVEDTMMLHYTQDTERKHGLKDIMAIEYNKHVVSYEEAVAKGFKEFARYGDNDARYTLLLFYDMQKIRKELEAKNSALKKNYILYKKIEIPYIRVMQEMNYFQNYIRVDKPLLQSYYDMIYSEMKNVEKLLQTKLGGINPNSPKQLGEKLEELGYKVKRNKPTAKMKEKAKAKGEQAIGNYSLSAEKISDLYLEQGGIVLALLIYNRKLGKIMSTYVSPILERLEEVEDGVWVLSGYSFFSIGTRTGRSACLRPNMQNQPRDLIYMQTAILAELYKKGVLKRKQTFLVKKDFDVLLSKIDSKKSKLNGAKYSISFQKFLNKHAVDMRLIYIPMPGKIFIGADHSQLELRVGAALTKDPEMLAAYNEADRDLHKETVAFINNYVGHDIIDRADGKTINFFYQYGGWYGTLAKRLGISMELAKKIDTAYRLKYKVKFEWIKIQIQKSRRSHFAQTILGRRRNMNTVGINDTPRFKSKEEKSRSFIRRNHAENATISTIISGSSADVLKVGQINIHEKYKKHVRQVLQIHDELLLEIDDNDQKEKWLKIINTEMENALDIGVKFKVEGKLGYSWRDVH